ncbi:MAG: hypothetical protein IJW86_00510 [Clostridia bacterium]|nr:hypothetical protein [Clostridia bacterium]
MPKASEAHLRLVKFLPEGKSCGEQSSETNPFAVLQINKTPYPPNQSAVGGSTAEFYSASDHRSPEALCASVEPPPTSLLRKPTVDSYN